MSTPTNKFKFKDAAQTRSMLLRAAAEPEGRRLDSEYYVEGYAARYEPYVLYDMGNYKVYERFEPGCFAETDMGDVILQYDHAGRVFARTTNNTLIVEADDTGLFTAADLSRTELARSLYEDINAGMITKMSWRFIVGDYDIEHTEGSQDITICHKRVPKIFDVSAVSIPANDNTEIGSRSFVDGVIAELARREADAAERRNRIKIKVKVMEELK